MLRQPLPCIALLLAAIGCAAASAPVANPSAAPSPERRRDSTVTAMVPVDEIPTDVLTRADSLALSTIARLASVEVEPAAIELHVGQMYPMRNVRVIWRDSSGAPIDRVPHTSGPVGEAAYLDFVGGEIQVVAKRPGTSEIRYRIQLQTRETPPGLPHGTLRVTVLP